ncbi:alpha/beta fold hydrolase [bacterium]|nr:alpha/beta fold hydrolase [bacterium]
MKQFKLIILFIIATQVIFNCSHSIPARESIMDNVTHIEDSLYLEFPDAPRLCDALEIEKTYVDIGDCKLYTEIEGSGTPLVLINGGPGASHHSFHPWLSEAKGHFQVIYYDQRGCGLSDYEPGQGYSFEQAVDDLEKLRKALKIEKWILLGHSYGGGIAQYYTIKYPEHVIGQVLVGSVPMMNLEEFQGGREQEYYSEAESKKIAELLAMARSREITIPQYVFNKDLNGGWQRGNYYKPTPERMAQNSLYDFVSDPTYSSDWAIYNFENAFIECPIPTLIMEGKYDLIWKADRPSIMGKYHPNAKLVVFETSGHNIFADEPQRFANEIKKWTNSVKPPTSRSIEKWKDSVDGIIGDGLKLIASSKDFMRLIQESGVQAASDYYIKFKKAQPEKPLFFEAAMNVMGYEYLLNYDLPEAIAVFKLNVAEFPDSWNTYDSLGEALLENGETEAALKNYQKSVELNPDNDNGIQVIQKLMQKR